MMWRAAAGLLLLVALPGCLNDFDAAEPNDLRISKVDVSAPLSTSGSVVLAVHTTVDNAQSRSGPVKLVVSAYDTASHLLSAREEFGHATLAKDRTETFEVRLTVPRADGYRIEVVLYEGGRALRTATVTVSNIGAIPPNVYETGLRVAEMDFEVSNVSANRVAIRVSTYLTNEGANASRPLRMQVKAREVSTDLLADESWVDVPTIGSEETRIHNATLSVPAGYNYVVEATIWDANYIVERGSGNVQLLPAFTKPTEQEIVVASPRLEDFARGGTSPPSASGAYKTPALGSVLGLLAIVAALVIVRRRK